MNPSKTKLSVIILIGIAVCLLLFNIRLLSFLQQDKNRLEKMTQQINQMEYLKEIEFMFEVSKEITVTRFKYEQYNIGNATLYTGSDKNELISIKSIINQPKLVLGLDQNMCSPCIYGVLEDLKKFFPDCDYNSNIIYIANIEQRFKDNYFNKKVVSFHQKNAFPLYEIGMPYFFILDEDLDVKMLFITDKASPELTQEYLKIIKERYPDI